MSPQLSCHFVPFVVVVFSSLYSTEDRCSTPPLGNPFPKLEPNRLAPPEGRRYTPRPLALLDFPSTRSSAVFRQLPVGIGLFLAHSTVRAAGVLPQSGRVRRQRINGRRCHVISCIGDRSF
jgi:hypothetical protein